MEQFLSDDLYAYANKIQNELTLRFTQELGTLVVNKLKPHLRNRRITVYNYDGLTIEVSSRKGSSTRYELCFVWGQPVVSRLYRLNPELEKSLWVLSEEVQSFEQNYGLGVFGAINLEV